MFEIAGYKRAVGELNWIGFELDQKSSSMIDLICTVTPSQKHSP